MTTVAQMIEWMKTLPQDAEVQCGVEVLHGCYTQMKMLPVDVQSSNSFTVDSPEDCKEFPSLVGKTVVMIRGE
jgi:hypothetical protein